MNPFDWPADPFLALYAALAVLLFGAGFLFRSALGSASARAPRLNELELAYLAGGADRLCDVALLCLASRDGASIAGKGGRIVVSDPTPLAAFAVDLRDMPRGSEMTLAEFRRAIEPAVARVRRDLQAFGLCPTDDQINAFRLSSLPFVGLLLAFGAIKAFIGASRHHPIGILLFFLVATLLAAALLSVRPVRTRAGGDALSAHRSANARASRAPLTQELLLAVALSGSAVLSGTAYASIHEARRAAGDGGGGGGCGGGGGGGGGCGGCS